MKRWEYYLDGSVPTVRFTGRRRTAFDIEFWPAGRESYAVWDRDGLSKHFDNILETVCHAIKLTHAPIPAEVMEEFMEAREKFVRGVE